MEAIEKNEAIIERPYTLRKMKDGDLMPLLSLFRKIGLKDFKGVITKAANGGSVQEIGITAFLDIGDVVISNLEGETGEEVYRFYSGLCGLTVEEMKELEFGSLPLMIYDSFSEVKNSSFFKVLARLL